MKQFLFTFLSLTLIIEHGFSLEPSGLRRAFLESLPVLFMQAHDYEPTEHQLTLFPERSELPLIGDRNRLTYTYALQADPTAPLVFVLPGTGGAANQNSTLAVAEMAFKAGYSVITVPSTSHWSFAIAASSNGRTGFPPKDGEDNYRFLLTLKYRLEREAHLQPRQFGLIGFSYGGLDGDQLLRQDLRQKGFLFDFFIAINPPLDLMTAIRKVDRYHAASNGWSQQRIETLLGFAQGRFLEVANGHYQLETTADAERVFPLSEEKLAWLLSHNFRESVKDSASIAETVAGNPSGRFKSLSTSIETYLLDKVITPLSSKLHISVDELLSSLQFLGNLKPEQKRKLVKTKLILFHAKNDFLSFPEELKKLDALPLELRLYENGGHLGNMTTSSFRRDLRATLVRLKKNK